MKHIGLTPNVYSKRLKASRILHAYPRAVAMLKAGETSVSQIALLHAKLTPANAELVFDGIRNKSKREVEQFLSRVTFDGQLLDREPEVELRLVLTKSQLDLLERAREILAASGHVPSSVEILEKALGDLLERRDPVRKAERAAARREKKQTEEAVAAVSSPGTDAAAAIPVDLPLPPAGPTPSPGTSRPAVPAAVRHEVVLRDGGRCTELLSDGSRCPERMMLWTTAPSGAAAASTRSTTSASNAAATTKPAPPGSSASATSGERLSPGTEPAPTASMCRRPEHASAAAMEWSRRFVPAASMSQSAIA